MKLIQTKKYLLLIDEEAEIKGTTCLCYNNIKNTWIDDVILYQGAMPEYHYNGFQKIIAYYPLSKEAKELDLPLLPNPFKDIVDTNIQTRNFNKQVKNPHLIEEGEYQVWERAYIEGFNDGLAQSKQFSLEDICGFSKWLDEEEFPYEDGSFIKYFNGKDNRVSIEWLFNKYLQSLSTQQLPKEFIPEYETPYSDGFADNRVRRFYGKPVLKTITNSEGKEILVGTYKY